MIVADFAGKALVGREGRFLIHIIPGKNGEYLVCKTR